MEMLPGIWYHKVYQMPEQKGEAGIDDSNRAAVHPGI